MGITVYNPTSGPSLKQLHMANRDKSLEGSVVALIDNGKRNSDTVLNYIGRRLKEKYGVKKVVLHKKASFSHSIDEGEAESLSRNCDFIISGIGD
jgi:hypothetical protein